MFYKQFAKQNFVGVSVVDRGGETVTDSDQPAQDPADPGLATATGLYKLSFVSWDTEGHDWDRKGENQKTGAGVRSYIEFIRKSKYFQVKIPNNSSCGATVQLNVLLALDVDPHRAGEVPH